jgi:GT2 family glycosyltransferase
MKNVFVIIVTYNGMKWINECLESVLTNPFNLEIVIIDNNSSDETVEYIELHFPEITLFKQTENLGFGKANNIGMAYALEQNADYVFLLNQDAFLDYNTIEGLIKVSELNPDYAILSPIQLDYSGKLLEYYFYKFLIGGFSREFVTDLLLQVAKKDIYEIPFVQAASWLLPIETIKKVGGFDPLFYHYGEDDNYCQRVKFHGFKIGVVSSVYIRHDSHKPKKSIPILFSERYFSDYLICIYFKYADINKEFDQKNIKIEIRKNSKRIVKSLLSLNFTNAYGYLKQIKVLKEKIWLINQSRNINKELGVKYLQNE